MEYKMAQPLWETIWRSLKKSKQLGMVVHVCNLSTQEPETNSKIAIKASLGYVARPCLKQINQPTKKAHN
jgi:hypothetical protein